MKNPPAFPIYHWTQHDNKVYSAYAMLTMPTPCHTKTRSSMALSDALSLWTNASDGQEEQKICSRPCRARSDGDFRWDEMSCLRSQNELADDKRDVHSCNTSTRPIRRCSISLFVVQRSPRRFQRRFILHSRQNEARVSPMPNYSAFICVFNRQKQTLAKQEHLLSCVSGDNAASMEV